MTTTHTQELINAVNNADSAPKLVAAVQALAAVKDEEAISPLIAVLGYNNLVAAVAAVEGLVNLGAAAVQPLIEQLDGYNYGARAYAMRALAAIADPRALDVLLAAAATDFAPSVRRAAAKGLGILNWHNLNTKERSSAQARAAQTLLSVAQDPEWSIRYAAVVGLQELAKLPDLNQQIQTYLEQMAQTDVEPAIQARVRLAQQQILLTAPSAVSPT